jgi:hypothetical protein
MPAKKIWPTSTTATAEAKDLFGKLDVPSSDEDTTSSRRDTKLCAFQCVAATQVSAGAISLADLAWNPGSPVPTEAVSTAVWRFECRHHL